MKFIDTLKTKWNVFFPKFKEISLKILKLILYAGTPLFIILLIAKSGSFDLGILFKNLKDTFGKIRSLGTAKEKFDTAVEDFKEGIDNIGNSEAEASAKKEVKVAKEEEAKALEDLENSKKNATELSNTIHDDKGVRDEAAKKFFPG